jgi:hypothetical protein
MSGVIILIGNGCWTALFDRREESDSDAAMSVCIWSPLRFGCLESGHS